MSICLTRFPIGGLGEPNIYHDSGVFYKNVGIGSVLWGFLTWWYFWWGFVLDGSYCFILLFLSSILISSLIIFSSLFSPPSVPQSYFEVFS